MLKVLLVLVVGVAAASAAQMLLQRRHVRVGGPGICSDKAVGILSGVPESGHYTILPGQATGYLALNDVYVKCPVLMKPQGLTVKACDCIDFWPCNGSPEIAINFQGLASDNVLITRTAPYGGTATVNVIVYCA